MSEWATSSELLALGCMALPSSKGAFNRYIERHGWRAAPNRSRKRSGQGGGWEYHYSLLPTEVQATLLAQGSAAHDDEIAERSRAAWSQYDTLPEKTKSTARTRLTHVDHVDKLQVGGKDATTAVSMAAIEAGVTNGTIWGWLRTIKGVPRADWEPALAPRFIGRSVTAGCDPRGWDFIKADYLRPEQPSFAACYRRLEDSAQENGWSPIPSKKTLQRRLKRDVPRGARRIARGGKDAALQVFPHQTRDRSVFTAMEAVNADGHKFDVFVKWEDGTIGRPLMVAIQDLYSGMIVGHRLDRSENWTAVRHAFADMMESFGIPEHVWFDNGRSFASKWLTGGMKTRYRFKIKDDEPEGLLTRLGITVHWATPYHGQAKPIERAFRDLCDEIAKHPKCAGAYTGNKPDAKPANYGSKAIPIEEFRALVAEQLKRHNIRKGRRTKVANGGSFAEAFRASLESPTTLVTKASPAQLRMFLMAAEGVTARKPTGEIQLVGNRYWSERLVDHMGEKLTVRFDPENLISGIVVYTRDGRFICEAECIDATGFNDIDAAREHAKRKRTWLKNQRECLELERSMSIADVARLLPQVEPAPRPQSQVVRLAVNAPQQHSNDMDEARAAMNFSSAINALDASANKDILSFPQQEEDDDG